MLTDIEIATQAKISPIVKIAEKLGLNDDDIELYGKHKAKIGSFAKYSNLKNQGEKLVLVTAINPTPAGEGKTTTTVGLADSLSSLGHPTIAALREPSLGPVFGVKGGAAGGGYAQVVPMEDINLHFTGDFHAIGAANNLLAAMLDNHIKQGNSLQINPQSITLKRVIDMNDRQLRYVLDGLSGPQSGTGSTANGIVREDGFDITVASEVMAIFCLANSLSDLKERLGKIVVASSFSGKSITADDLEATGAMTALLKDAIKPNLVQTLEGTPALIHGGPFANIAHGCNSAIATKTALGLVGSLINNQKDENSKTGFVVTEAGFGADLGAEKFIDIKCRQTGLFPDVVVIVATIRALKSHGGVEKTELNSENLPALEAGLPNLLRHIENIKTNFKLPVIVALNKFPTDTDREVEFAREKLAKLEVELILSDVWAKGSAGGKELAEKVVELSASSNLSENSFCYDLKLGIEEKIKSVAEKIYHADGVILSAVAKRQIADLEEKGFGNLPICVAKTQYSFSDQANKLGAPTGFKVNVKKVKVAAGAGFIVVYTGDIMTMPGLPKVPAANNIDVDENGNITGLF